MIVIHKMYSIISPVLEDFKKMFDMKQLVRTYHTKMAKINNIRTCTYNKIHEHYGRRNDYD